MHTHHHTRSTWLTKSPVVFPVRQKEAIALHSSRSYSCPPSRQQKHIESMPLTHSRRIMNEPRAAIPPRPKARLHTHMSTSLLSKVRLRTGAFFLHFHALFPFPKSHRPPAGPGVHLKARVGPQINSQPLGASLLPAFSPRPA